MSQEWQTAPKELRNAIERYNREPLQVLRETPKAVASRPEVAQKLGKSIELAQVHDQDHGLSLLVVGDLLNLIRDGQVIREGSWYEVFAETIQHDPAGGGMLPFRLRTAPGHMATREDQDPTVPIGRSARSSPSCERFLVLEITNLMF